MLKTLARLRVVWFFMKAIFSTRIKTDADSKTGELSVSWKKYNNTVKDFLDKYDVENEDKIDYNNTRKHHYAGFVHLDNPNHPEFKDKLGGDRVLEGRGLIYNDDGKTPFNPSEVFDMTYEEYSVYKEKILPRAATRRINYNEIKQFLNVERGVSQSDTAKAKTGDDKPKRKRRRRKPRARTTPNDGGGTRS
jgi:hypothetical protein